MIADRRWRCSTAYFIVVYLVLLSNCTITKIPERSSSIAKVQQPVTPNNPVVQLALADALLNEGHFEEAAERLKLVEPIINDLYNRNRVQGKGVFERQMELRFRLAILRRDKETLDQISGQIIGNNGRQVEAFRIIGFCFRYGMPDYGLELVEAALGHNPLERMYYFYPADYYRKTMQHQIGITYFERLCHLYDTAPCHCEYAQILLEMREGDRAQGYIRRALQIDPKYADAYILLYNIDNDVGHLNRAIELDPTNTQGWCLLAERHFRSGVLKQAEEYFGQCLSIDPYHHFPVSYLVEIYLIQQRYTEAETLLDRMLRRAPPDDRWPAVKLARVKIVQGLLPEAERLLKEAIEVGNTFRGRERSSTIFLWYYIAIHDLANCLRMQGKFEELDTLYR